MARKHRIWYPGAKYHITSRGIRRTSLFHDDHDHEEYIQLLIEAKARFSFLLHTYCLMTNHIHLQVETSNTPPDKIIKLLHNKYAKYFNKRHRYSGHVFESCYGAELIDSPAYELEVSKYIHLNPLKANMTKNLEDYRWSSCRAYLKKEENPLVTTQQILSYFSEPKSTSYEQYLKTIPPIPNLGGVIWHQ